MRQFISVLMLMIGLLAAGSANATPITWNIPNTALTPNQGSFTSGSIYGTFSWDADTQTASNINITVMINGNTSIITSSVSNFYNYYAVFTNSLANGSPTAWVSIPSLTNSGGTSDAYVVAGFCLVDGASCDSDDYGEAIITLTGTVPPAPPPIKPIPTLSEWAQILMMLMMIGSVGWYSRKMTR